jgi:hypothetical protein
MIVKCFYNFDAAEDPVWGAYRVRPSELTHASTA